MILYFTGTGNSKYAAERLAELLDDELISINDKIRAKDKSALTSEKPWVIVVPTYAWQIPKIVEEWIAETELKGSKKVYLVMTCGESTGAAEMMTGILFDYLDMDFCGCEKIVMPDNYFIMFEPPTQEKIKSLLREAETRFEPIAERIRSGEKFDRKKISLLDKIYSIPVNALFYKISVKAKPFYATEKCVSCGHCEKVCPLNNIKLTDGKPVWGKECTHCMACICTCPKEAIEYGKKTQGKVRYRFPAK